MNTKKLLSHKIKFLLLLLVLSITSCSLSSDELLNISPTTTISPTNTQFVSVTITQTPNPSPSPTSTTTSTLTVSPSATQISTATPAPPVYSTLQDGTYLVYSAVYSKNNDPLGDLYYQSEIISLDGSIQGYLMQRDSANGDISPDGKLLAYLD